MTARRTRPTDSDPQRLSRAAAHRLSLYLRALAAARADGETVSSKQIARLVGASEAQVRRDLASLGHLGQRGVGYDSGELAAAIRRTLGIDRPWRAVLVGVGNLARALLRYQGFRAQGFQIVGLFDADPGKIGQSVEGLPVEPTAKVAERAATLAADLGVISVPAEPAQAVADALVAGGVKGVLNFAPTLLKLPPHVRSVTVDLTIMFEQLAFLVQHGESKPPAE